MTNRFNIVCQADSADITLYDVIDSWYGVSVSTIRDALKEAGEKVKTIRIRINSPGGSVFEGTAIYNLLRSHSAKKIVSVDGLAASMASLVAMAGDEIEMGEGAYLMIHDPLATVFYGAADEMRDMASLLEMMKEQLVGIYSRRTGQSEAQVAQWMTDETWMTADEALNNRFADRKVAGLKVAAHYDPSRFRNPPSSFSIGALAMSQDTVKQAAIATPGPATYKELKASCVGADEKFLCAQLDAESTVSQAVAAWMVEQNRRIEAVQREASEVKAAAEAASRKPGVPAVGTASGKSDSTVEDPIAAWNKIVDGYKAKGHAIGKALSLAVRNHPDAHEAYLHAYNVMHGRG